MKDKLELQKQYIEVKKKYDELSEKYWSQWHFIYGQERYDLENSIKDTFTLLKSINKQMYYGESI